MSSLQVVPISKAAANQRAGRAGRVMPGKCFRLFTKWEFEQNLDDSNTPEILRANLCNVVLQLKALNVSDVLRFDFMDPPPTDFLVKSLEMLYGLMALNSKGELTTLGRRMAEFPLEPMMAKALISSQKYQVVDEVVSICSVLTCGDALFFRPKEKALHADNAKKNFHRAGGDHFMMLNIYKQWEDTGFSQQWCVENYLQYRPLNRARDIRDQLLDLLKKVDIEVSSNPGNEEGIRKSILAGYFFHCARLNKNGSYTTLKNPHSVEIHPSSSLLEFKPKMICYHELWKTEKEYMRECIEVQAKWLAEVAPYYYSKTELRLEDDAKVKPRNMGSATAG
ncbi:unnamed protein product [Amoebophrya sp. A25]|nr:unnamed protein product [Amoebophrya sp. A25]|eukprot:GSA25T00000347001.1